MQIKRWVSNRLPPQVRRWLWARKVAFGNRRIRELGHHLSARMQQIAKADIDQLERIESKVEWESFRDERIDALRRALADRATQLELPDSMITGALERDGYHIDNVVFQGHRDLPVTANRYCPTRMAQKGPAILICHSHHDPKTEEELQCMGMTWAQQGCTVLIMDMLGHGERRQHPFRTSADYRGSFRIDRQDYYFRSVLGMQLEAIGESLMGWMVQDIRRGIDLLWADPGIDRDRLIVIGAVAGGGDLAAIVGALDDRVAAVAVFNFGQLSLGEWDPTRSLPDTARLGFWPWIILASIAPRRLIYGREFAWDPQHDRVWKHLEKTYSLYGRPDALRSVHGSGRGSRHGPMDSHCTNVGSIHRNQLYPILQEWFDIPVPEREVNELVPKKQLECLTLDARRMFAVCSVHEMAHNISNEQLATVRRVREIHVPSDRATQLRQELVNVLGPMTPSPSYRVRSHRQGLGRSESVVLEVEENLYIRLQLLWPSGLDNVGSRVVIGVAQEGNRFLRSERRSLIRCLLDQKFIVCLTEVRGIGDGRHGELYRGRLSPSANVAATSVMLGEDLLCSRVRDLRTVIAYLCNRGDIDRNRIGLWGDSLAVHNEVGDELAVPLNATPYPERGEPFGGVATLLSALYEPHIQAVYIHGGLMSYESLLEEPFVYQPADSLIRGILTIADLPDICGALAPRSLRMEGLVDGCNRRVSRTQIDEKYELARSAYAQAERTDRLSIGIKKASGADISMWFGSHV